MHNIARPMRNFKKGFTLVELLLFIGLYSALLLMITHLFTTVVDVKLSSQGTASIQDDGNYLLTRLTYDIRRADEIISPVLGASSSELILNIQGINYFYRLSNNNLEISENTGSYQLNSYLTEINNLSFSRRGNINGKNTLEVDFDITSRVRNTAGKIESKKFHTAIGIR